MSLRCEIRSNRREVQPDSPACLPWPRGNTSPQRQYLGQSDFDAGRHGKRGAYFLGHIRRHGEGLRGLPRGPDSKASAEVGAQGAGHRGQIVCDGSQRNEWRNREQHTHCQPQCAGLSVIRYVHLIPLGPHTCMDLPVCSEAEASSKTGIQYEVSVEIESEGRSAPGDCTLAEGRHEPDTGEPQFGQSIELGAVQREDSGIRLTPRSGVYLSRSVIRKCGRSSPERRVPRPRKQRLSHSGLPCVRCGQSSQEQQKYSAQTGGKVYAAGRGGVTHGFFLSQTPCGVMHDPLRKIFPAPGCIVVTGPSHISLFRPPETEQVRFGMSKSPLPLHKNPHPVRKNMFFSTMRFLLSSTASVVALLLFSLFFSPKPAAAQEFNCAISVNYSTLTGSDFGFLEDLELRMEEYVNDRFWTEDSFREDERIECTMDVIVLEAISLTSFNARLVVATRRPIYNTMQHSTVVRFSDESWQFRYAQGQPLVFNLEQYDPLTSVIDFYAYMMLGYDYDTFSELGGTPHFETARRIAERAQSVSGEGWSELGSPTEPGRGNLITQVLDPRMRPLRKAYFDYHFGGLDRFLMNPDTARNAILQVLSDLDVLYEDVSRQHVLDLFFLAKYNELAAVFEGWQGSNQAYDYLTLLDPAHTSVYEDILE